MSTRVALEIGFASNPPDTFLVHGTEVHFFSLPQGVQVAAFESSNAILPAGISGDKIIGVNTETSTSVSCDIVFRVEQDQELVAAVASDLRDRLKLCGFTTRLWLLNKTTDKYTYAYIRALEKDHE